MSREERVGVALVGAGGSGKNHVRNCAAISAVVVATHAPSHFEIVAAALHAGRDAFVEKPLCLSGDQAAQSFSIAEKGGRILMVGDTSAAQKLAVFDKGVEPPATLTYEEGARIRTGDVLIPALKMAEPLRRESLVFLDVVRTRNAPIADGQSGLDAVRALEGDASSLAQGGARIELAGER